MDGPATQVVLGSWPEEHHRGVDADSDSDAEDDTTGTGSSGSGNASGHGSGSRARESQVTTERSHTTTTITITTTTETPASTTTTTLGLSSVRLYCWALMMPHGAEVSLIRTLLNRGAGLFACNDYSVFSEGDIELSPGPPSRIGTTDIGSVKCKYGGKWYLALNSPVFIKVWKKIFELKIYRKNDWTVKLDPDTVFIANRLRKQMLHADPNAIVYLNNCDQGLHGPIEVIAVGGMRAFEQGIGDCEKKLSYEFDSWGEDVFLRHCLGILKVNRVDNFKLLSEDRCFYENPAQNGCTSGKVCFHPFKKPDVYFKCLSEAGE